MPDTVCVNETFTIQNTSTGSVSSSYWNFFSSTVTLGQSLNIGGSALTYPTYMSINEDGGNYYAFISNNGNGTITRAFYGNSLNNIPIYTNLGSFSSTLPFNCEGIVIEKEGSNWYGIVVGGPGASSRICRLSFGSSLANIPTVVNMGNIGNLNYPHRLIIVQEGANKYGFTVNRDGNTITRFEFGNSLSNIPTATNLGNIGNLGGPNGLALINYQGTWYGFVTNDGNQTITRLNFGSVLTNTPTGTTMGGVPTFPRGIYLDITCNGIVGQLTTYSNGFYRLSFLSGPTGP
ncbi:MAG: hypothetical protein AB7O73_15855, partial [Bacteroidia bacterium]